MSAHDVVPLDEPKTPMWLPALGCVLFLVVGIWWATGSSSAQPTDAATGDTAAGADAGAATPPPQAPPSPH